MVNLRLEWECWSNEACCPPNVACLLLKLKPVFLPTNNSWFFRLLSSSYYLAPKSHFRCYVGVEKEQWRSCSVSFIPVHTQQGSFSNQQYTVTRYPIKKHDIYHQAPPRPGGLHSRDLPEAASQLLPIQYLYHEGPPNATQINNNIIDCNRDRCWQKDWNFSSCLTIHT